MQAKLTTTGSLLGRGPGAREINLLQPVVAERLSCSPTSWTTSFTTRLDRRWTSLTARSQTCTSSTATGAWVSGQTFSVTRYVANGQKICRGSTYGYGSSYWYRTSRGWVWSGGTADPIWNTAC